MIYIYICFNLYRFSTHFSHIQICSKLTEIIIFSSYTDLQALPVWFLPCRTVHRNNNIIYIFFYYFIFFTQTCKHFLCGFCPAELVYRNNNIIYIYILLLFYIFYTDLQALTMRFLPL